MEDPFEDFSRDPVRILERLGCVNGCFQVIPGGFLTDSWRIPGGFLEDFLKFILAGR